jgi:uncharacterized protein YndB with AHSA1/START domain
VTKPAVIQLNHFYPQPPAAVWKALTDPELLARWWAAGDVQPVVGHRFDLDTLTHEGFNLDSPMGRQAFEGMKPGWPAVLARLASVLRGDG